MGRFKELTVRIISRIRLRNFWEENSKSEQALKAWYEIAKKAFWQNPQEIKNTFGNASFLSNNRVIFNIHGNSYRLVVAIKYEYSIC